MSERELKGRGREEDEPAADDDAAAPAPAATERNEALDDDVDAMLDEIDDVLETNAAEFVQGFVQKGGQ
jgi:ubiquitin-like protein Pup